MISYKNVSYFTDAINSLLVLTWTEFALIVLDNCSTDNTLEIYMDFEVNDHRIKVFKYEKNLGDYPILNQAIF